MTPIQLQFSREVVLGKSQTDAYRSVMKKGQLFISLLVALCLFALLPAYGEEVLRGKVINVVDGDTLDVQVGPGKHRIRLAEIDAPERNQPWGDEAKRGLASKVLEHEVRVVVTDTDRYGRRVGKIFLGQTDILIRRCSGVIADCFGVTPWRSVRNWRTHLSIVECPTPTARAASRTLYSWSTTNCADSSLNSGLNVRRFLLFIRVREFPVG